ncbi:hypothetical protein CBS12448_10527 [Aspergillus niger]|nr:hypothetical protein CBS12448_10527 [Aspergillus niger]KAI3003085.1 hypothetical protein CBS147346_5550 [Aspergillus niger]
MTVRDTVLLLVSVGRFSCFGYGASSLRGSGRVIPAAISFGGAVYLSRYRVSLREFDGLLNLVFSERIWSSTSCSSSLRESGLQPLAVSPRESGLLLVCSCADSLREFRLVIFSIDRLKPPPPSVSVSPPPSMFAMSQPEIADRFPSPLQKPEYHCLPVFRRNISSLKDANSPLTTSIEYHASLTRTKPGIEIAMRKVQDDRLNWEHDMIAKLGDFLIEEVDQQLQDTRSKGSCWYMKSTYNDIPIRAVGHLQRDGPVAKVLP